MTGLDTPQPAEKDAPDLAEATGYRDTVTGGLADDRPAEFSTKPNPNQPDRCPSIDPHDTLQCGRRIHDDDQCQFGGIAWKKGTPRHMSDRERADRLEAMCDRLAGRIVELQDELAVARR
jgi:hypothetical protein